MSALNTNASSVSRTSKLGFQLMSRRACRIDHCHSRRTLSQPAETLGVFAIRLQEVAALRRSNLAGDHRARVTFAAMLFSGIPYMYTASTGHPHRRARTLGARRPVVAWCIGSIAALSLLLPGVARAQSAQAEVMFGEGERAMAAGKIAEACAAFEASNNLAPGAGTLIRLGQCREQNHEIASAWAAYKSAIARVKDPRKREFAAGKIAELEPRLSHLTIVVGAHKIDGLAIERDGKPVDAVTWDRALPIDGGSYVIAASAPGYDGWQITVAVPPENGNVRAEVPALRHKPAAPPAAPPMPPALTPVMHDEGTPTTRNGSWLTSRRKIALGAAGVAAAGAITGAVLGVIARGKHADAFKLCPDPAMPCADAARADSLTASAHRLGIGADVGFGIAAAGAITAGALWLTGAPESRRTAIVPTANGVAVMGRF
jgi:hypothetical protein